MKIFDKYVVREHIAPFLFAFSVIMFVLVLKLMLDIMALIISKGVGVLVLIQVLFYNLAWMVALVVPMSVLVSTVMAFGRMGSAGEITAMKASGISMYRIATPVVILSLLITAGMVWFNNVVLPESNHRARSIMSAIYLSKPMLTLKNKERQFISEIPNLTIHVEDIEYDTGEMHGVTLFRTSATEDEQTAIHAANGHFLPASSENNLTLVLDNGEIHRLELDNMNRYIRGTFNLFRYNLVLNNSTDTSLRASKTDRTMTSTEMRNEIGAIQRHLDENKPRLEKLKADNALDTAEARNLQRLNDIDRRRIHKYLIEIHKKNSIPFAALIFVLIGAPLGILVRRSGASIGIGLSIGFFMIYYLFLIGGESAGDRMLVDPWIAMWAPNIILGVVGLFLFRYAVRR